ncbi:MAG: polysaccharide biosynthesis/export family protein, partial [Planctomycetes bacterium]|nr:polysaccharide biosynthesis/export family protein [Planctomycetota bacterium]
MRADRHRFAIRPGCGAALLASALMMGGCNWDSYLNPSTVGRWEMTPTTVPILTSLAVIEDQSATQVEYTDVTPEDLIPEIREYRISPGEQLEVTIFGLFVPGSPEKFFRVIDARGFVDLPQIGPVYVVGLTRDESETAIQQAAQPIVADAVVSVVLLSRRRETYSLIGSVSGPGTFVIPEADFRLLEALSLSGAFNEDAKELYVIRQVALTGAAAGETQPPTPAGD